MRTKKNTRTNMLVVLLIAIVIFGYKFLFVEPIDEFAFQENQATMDRVTVLIQSIENINFDTSVINDPKFNSLESIEIPLINLPLGKTNPFSQN